MCAGGKDAVEDTCAQFAGDVVARGDWRTPMRLSCECRGRPVARRHSDDPLCAQLIQVLCVHIRPFGVDIGVVLTEPCSPMHHLAWGT